MKNILILLITLFSVHLFAGPKEKLIKAHEAFLDGDYNKMAHFMKAAIIEAPGNLGVEKNVYQLLNEAYKKTNGYIGVKQDIPSHVEKISIQVRKTDQRRELKVILKSRLDNYVNSMKVFRSPNIPVLDSKNNIGKYSKEYDKSEGLYYYSVKTYATFEPIASGLYTVKVEVSSGQPIDIWFFLSPDLNTSLDPVVHSPKPNQVYHTAYPIFRFDSYKSPEYKGYGWRNFGFVISPHTRWEEIWMKWGENKDLTSITPDIPLEKGDYDLYMRFDETFRFGKLRISRTAATLIPFKMR